MAKFRFQGEIPGSKSVFNRALIVQSYFPELKLQGSSQCDDVRFMREGLKQLSSQSPADCGEGGTTFRFMALRASRIAGEHILKGSSRLMKRPQQGLLNLLQQLGVQVAIQGDQWHLKSSGWKPLSLPLQVQVSESSQYASALVLNAWLLDFDLEFELTGEKLSESYFLLTLEMLRSLGMTFLKTERGYCIPARQTLKASSFLIEPDMSSAFTMAAAGVLSGGVCLENFPAQSGQPDIVFVDILKKMNVDVSLIGSRLSVNPAPHLQAVEWNLSQSPDLFPVLAMLCTWADGVSKLYGAPHLVSKESNRIVKVSELLSLVGVHHEPLSDGMIIYGNPQQTLAKKVLFNPDKDHRMVMAAVLMKLKGHEIQIEEPEVINKSFPEFWDMIGIAP